MFLANVITCLIIGKGMKITSVFQTPQSKNFINVGLLAIRIGIGAGFLWAGIHKVIDPQGFGMMLQNMAGIDPVMAPNMALIIGSLEILSGVLVWTGLLTRPAVAFQIAILIGAQFMFGFDFTQGPAIWKDPSLIGIAVMLLLYGSGKYSLDHIISKKPKITEYDTTK